MCSHSSGARPLKEFGDGIEESAWKVQEMAIRDRTLWSLKNININSCTPTSIHGCESFRMLPSLPRLSTLPIISQPFKRSQEGLFHGKMKQYGNNVPHSKHKTRRTWLPNVRSKRLPLEATGETIKLKVTTRALRCIKKVCYICPTTDT